MAAKNRRSLQEKTPKSSSGITQSVAARQLFQAQTKTQKLIMKTGTLKMLNAIAVLVFAMKLGRANGIDPDNLADSITQTVGSNCPEIDQKKLAHRAFSLAQEAVVGATNYATLEANLESAFKKSEELGWTNNESNLKQAAAALATKYNPEATPLTKAANADNQKPKAPIGEDPNTRHDTNDIWGHISIWTGAKFSNPYKIVGNQLSAAGSTSDGYIELNLSSRYVERSGTNTDWSWSGTNRIAKGSIAFSPFWEYGPDIDTRLGYIFRGGGTPTNFVASTVVGSADFYGDTSIGLPLVRFCSLGGSWKQQLSLELNGGFATAKDELSLHPNAFFGLGWQASYQAMGTTDRGYWYGRAGVSLIDQPILIDGTDTVVLNQLSQPEYDLTWVPSIGVIVTYPLSSTISLQAGVNAYFTQSVPASWNATIGATLDLDKFFGALLGK
jgi:hypothetical protein